MVAIQPLDARDFTRVLSAVSRSRLRGCRVEELLDVRDRRTLKALTARAGLDRAEHDLEVSVEQFLASQRFVPPTNAGLDVLRAVLLNHAASDAWPPAQRLVATHRRRLERSLPDTHGRTAAT
jgi:hypothetical protein